jgi:5-methyltetrahydropteroyltriglutamate--homocysteine methyltransferase
MWVPEVTGKVYASKEELGEEVVQILGDEVEALEREGAAFIQFDEPVLTELVFTQGQTRTFMCAALAAHKDPEEELEFAVNLINQVASRASKSRTGLHVCRGNWSQKEETLLKGGYSPLAPYLERLNVDQLVLEYATPRAGELVAVPGKELGLGVVNPRTENVESPDEIVARVQIALNDYPAEKLFLNPDCGFATFSLRPMNEASLAEAKMRSLVEAAKSLRRIAA